MPSYFKHYCYLCLIIGRLFIYSQGWNKSHKRYQQFLGQIHNQDCKTILIQSIIKAYNPNFFHYWESIYYWEYYVLSPSFSFSYWLTLIPFHWYLKCTFLSNKIKNAIDIVSRLFDHYHRLITGYLFNKNKRVTKNATWQGLNKKSILF